MAEPIYGRFTQAEFDTEYNPRETVPEFPQYASRWMEESAAVRAKGGATCDIAYGPSPAETLDVFHAADPAAPILMFFHGGYWRSMDKAAFSFLAPAFVAAGATVVVPNYALCPSVTITEIVRQCRAVIAWTWRNAAKIGGDPARLHVSGHSAGGHITGMALATDWNSLDCPAEIISSACALSGLHDLDAIRRTYLNADLHLTTQEAEANSPVRLVRPSPVPLLLSLGGLESGEFHRQTSIFEAAWRVLGNRCEMFAVPGTQHYSVLEAFGDPAQRLGRAMLGMMKLG